MKKIFSFSFIFLSLSVFATNRQVNNEPTEIELSGKLKRETFPGPPNYESIKNGDEIETHYYLSLNEKIDVLTNTNNKISMINDESVKNVDILQLVITNDSDWVKLKNIGVGANIKIKGTLFKRHTGHHHSRVLLEAKNIIF